MRKFKFFLKTFGCKVNQYESQAIREAWILHGGEECEKIECADIVCINGCAITRQAERDSRNAVFKVRKINPDARIILTGCAAQFFESFQPRKNATWFPPDFVVPQAKKRSLLSDPWKLNENVNIKGSAFGIKSFKNARAVLKIQDGCSHNCTFCIVPQTRQKSVSRPPREILAEAESLIQLGISELVLSGVNLRLYGWGNDFGNFWDLLRFLDSSLGQKFSKHVRLRISSLEPGQLDGEALDALANCSLVCPQLHISLQHASQDILRLMGRGHYSAKALETAIHSLKQIWPVMGLGADFLVGFPGEKDSDIVLLLQFIRDLPFSYGHVFPFSARPMTAAEKLPAQLPRKIKNERTALVRQLLNEKNIHFRQKQLNLKEVIVVPEHAQISPGICRGINEFYTPCYFHCEKNFLTAAFIRVHPLDIYSDGLWVEPCTN